MLFYRAPVSHGISPWYVGKLLRRGGRDLFISGNQKRLLLLSQRYNILRLKQKSAPIPGFRVSLSPIRTLILTQKTG